MEIVYKPYTELFNWERNTTIRTISTDNFEKLLQAIRREGIKEAFKIGQDNTVYDGNNRLKGLNQIIAEGTTTAQNGVDLTQVPCVMYNPQTEGQKADLALSGNEQFAAWDKDGLMNYLPEIENELDMSLYNVDFFEPESILEQIEEVADEPSGSSAPKQVTCPNCNHQFTPVK